MKTPTLIVRLAGLYLLARGSITLIEIRQAQSFGIGAQQQSIVSNIQLYAIVGLIVGIVATLFAGWLARLLTFDSEPKKEEVDLTARLLKQRDEEA
jgi:preprotein translocase subunit SecF